MTENAFIERWQAEREVYHAWGSQVVEALCDEIAPVIGTDPRDNFLKIPPLPRLKADKSLLDKAFYRSKNYANPYEDITDKVGVRFVVLLTKHIDIVVKAVSRLHVWESSKDKDFEEERNLKPEFFGYQSVHFIVRPKYELSHNGILIPARTPCEIQIRTLLQHAHSELTHDTTYKASVATTASVKRHCARSMALIEAVDDCFIKVFDEISAASAPLESAMDTLDSLYLEITGRHAEKARVSDLILSAFTEKLTPDDLTKVTAFIKERPYLSENIEQKQSTSLLFRQSVVLLIYYLVDTAQRQLIDKWPLTSVELDPFFVDLGVSREAL